MKRLVVSIGLATGLIATSAIAQVSDAAALQARNDPFNGRTASLVFAVQREDVWSLVSVFSQPFGAPIAIDPTRPRRWVARRQTGQGDAFSGVVTWADSVRCPQLEGVLWSLHQAEVPSFDIPGITAVRPGVGVEPVPVPTHGPVFTIWGQGDQPSGALSWMRVQPFGGELAQWGLNAERHLADCWTEETPTAEGAQ